MSEKPKPMFGSGPAEKWREDFVAHNKRIERSKICTCEKPRITYKAVPPMCLWCGKAEE